MRDDHPKGIDMSDVPVRIGVVGLGYWGPNLARNFDGLPGVELAWCCDAQEERRERLAAVHRSTRFTGELEELLEDPKLDAIVLATPVPSHAEHPLSQLGAGKHC